MPPRAALLVLIATLAACACQRPRVANPQAAVRAYAVAAERGDADALYALLSRRSQRELGRQGTRDLVRDTRRELSTQAKALRGDAPVHATAVVRYVDGEQAVLELEEGVFKLSSAGTLPAAAKTPVQALGDLRRALSRRSYAAFLRLLSRETQSAIESDLSAIVEGLEDPETLEVDLRGDAAEVELPGGHVVRLKREAGTWRVEDLE